MKGGHDLVLVSPNIGFPDSPSKGCDLGTLVEQGPGWSVSSCADDIGLNSTDLIIQPFQLRGKLSHHILSWLETGHTSDPAVSGLGTKVFYLVLMGSPKEHVSQIALFPVNPSFTNSLVSSLPDQPTNGAPSICLQRPVLPL